jgi:hypothetical protein
MGGRGVYSPGLRQGQMAVSVEHANDPSSSIKCEGIFDYPKNYQLLKGFA